MIDPALALQTALHDHIVSQPAVTALVPVSHIRDGTTRPGDLPTIIITVGSAIFNGRAAGSQHVATVFADLHVWALEDGPDTAKAIAGAVAHTLIDWPDGVGFEFDHFKLLRTVYPRDPDPQIGHAVMSIEATIRWRL